MRGIWVAGLGFGALFAGGFVVNCSSSEDSSYDAGGLPDAFFPEQDGSSSDASPPAVDGGDATALAAEDSAVPASDAGDAGDSAAGPLPDAGRDAERDLDAGDAGTFDRGDASESDAGVTADASKGVQVDAGPSGVDAGSVVDASSPRDASPGQDAGTAHEGADASANSGDASASVDSAVGFDAGPSDDAGGFDAASLCGTFNAGQNPILGVAAYDGSQLVEEDSVSNGYVGGTAPAYGDSVAITAWTLPLGIMQGFYVVYSTDSFATTAQVQLASTGATDAGPSSFAEGWTAEIPAQAHGTNVVWYVYGYDACAAGAQYFSHSGGNYAYATP